MTVQGRKNGYPQAESTQSTSTDRAPQSRRVAFVYVVTMGDQAGQESADLGE